MSEGDTPEAEIRRPFDRGVDSAALERSIDELMKLCADYRETFSSDFGKRVLADMKRRYCFFRSTHMEPGFPYETMFREGCRTVICDIEAAMSPQEPERLIEQLRQHKRTRDPFDVLEPRRETDDDLGD